MRLAWVGNSFVYFNDLPAMVAAMLTAAVAGDVKCVEHGQVTPGGQRFAGHAQDSKVHELLDGSSWDVVVLQDNSGVPGGADDAMLSASLTALSDSLLPRIPPACRAIIYGTWGHRKGSVYETQRGAYPDFVTMQRLTTSGCERYAHLLAAERGVADDLSSTLAPVGDAFLMLYEEEVAAGRDPIDDDSLFSRLFAPDKFHPSRLGSFLAACVYVEMLRGDAAFPLQWLPAPRCAHDDKLTAHFGAEWSPSAMSNEEAGRLQRIAQAAVRARRQKAAAKTANVQ